MTPEKLVSFVHTDPVITAQLRSITPLAIAATDAAAEFRVTARPAAADFPALLLARHHGERGSGKAWRRQMKSLLPR